MSQIIQSQDRAGHPLRLVQISDTHLGKHQDDTLLGMKTEESFCDVLAILPEADYLVATGDISNDGSTESYRRFLGLAQSATSIPLICVPGNHDDDSIMKHCMEKHLLPRQLLTDNWQLIFLNSRVAGFEHGDLTHAELDFLTSALSEHTERHILIFLHHQVVPVGSKWIDQYILRSHREFFEVVDQFPQVKAICWGHVHQAFHQQRNGVDLFACPSTCAQFKPNLDPFTLDNTMPGYRLLELFDDGRIESQVVRTQEKDYGIDFKAGGY